ncbi:cytochrome P450 [Nonomuraea sp. NPDC050153]|uniref:cytochrome P450 n=1 Tax=Nonomuraea sp. NPDC050153 TaxID=3364359 RepID=UPI0037ACCCFE
MSTQTHAGDKTALPAFPGMREARCPFDPPPEYRDWREQDGLRRVDWHGTQVWAASRFEDIRAVLSDPRISTETMESGDRPTAFPKMDDPEHARLRRMLTKDFTVKRVQAMRPHIQEMVNDILDKMISKGQPADLVTEYALPVPSLVISLLLGVPYTDHELFQRHSAVVVNVNASAEEKEAASAALFLYLLELVARKERERGDDLLSRLIAERVTTGEISRETAAMNGIVLLIAGHETTANMISLSTLTLLRNPETLARIRDAEDPVVIANAVEELLRYLTIVQDMIVRVALEDLTIGGQLIRAGEQVVMNLSAGNRDAAFFTDPDRFDIARNARGHLAFGYGVHQCLGQSLARVELEIALPALLRRLPGLKPAVPIERLKFRNEMATYGLHELPVGW